jgi:hypothetical protein
MGKQNAKGFTFCIAIIMLLFFPQKSNQKPVLLTRHVTFFIAKKVTKKSSDPKNSPWDSITCLGSCFAFSLFRFSLPISCNNPYVVESCFVNEIGRRIAQTILARSSQYENEFLKSTYNLQDQ